MRDVISAEMWAAINTSHLRLRDGDLSSFADTRMHTGPYPICECRPGVTYVGSTVQEFLETGVGVCQDYVHLGLIMRRRTGIAARYISGYLWLAPEDEGADSVEVETHAWVEALLPGADGRGEPVWVGADPTNRQLSGERHVKIGHGRHYADVPPVRGVYQGNARSQLEASVHMMRLDPQTSARPAFGRPGRALGGGPAARAILSGRPACRRSFFCPLAVTERLMARGDVRIAVTLACETCKRRNYQTNKSKRNNPDRISLRKYCKWCKEHTSHRETR